MRYRPDIDGLRGVAVLLVVAYHAFPNVIPGGFVGVDVFFVMSGFLITSIIIGELQAGTFRALHFYNRRVLRIFPALIAVLSATAIAGSLVLSNQEFEQLARHEIAGSLFVVNAVLSSESGYFDSAAA